MVAGLLFDKKTENKEPVGAFSVVDGNHHFPILAKESNDECVDSSNDHTFQGYLFRRNENDKKFKCVVLDSYCENLEDRITSLVTNKCPSIENFDFLCRCCHDVTLALAKLHERNIYLDGQLDPSKVFVEPKSGQQTVKLVLPDDQTSWYGKDTFSIQWRSESTTEKEKQEKDLVSLSLVLYFILTSGKKISDICQIKEEYIIDNWKIMNKALSNWLVFCEKYCTTETHKYRVWKVNLFDHFLTWILEKRRQIDAAQILYHPFFWNSDQIRSFIMASANYLKEGNCSAKDDFVERKIDLKPLSKWYPKNVDFLKTSWTPKETSTSNKDPRRNPGKHKETKRDIRVTQERELLTALRNKCAHWSERQNLEYEKEALEELRNIPFCGDELSNANKFCLFWMAMFPSVLIFTWETLKSCDFPTHFPEFYRCL